MAKDITAAAQNVEAKATPAEADVDANEPKITSKATAKPRKKKLRRSVTLGQVHVLASFNNTIVTITDQSGNALASSSAGSVGFRGSKKGTAYGAQVAAEKATETAKTFGLSKVDVLVKGVGLGRDAAIRTLIAQRIEVDSIKDITGIPHGGTRPRKAKRN